MGAVTASLFVLGLGLGWFIDQLLGTFPIFLLIGLLVGMAAAGTYTYTEFRKFLNN
jgi:F0F1-type ATP synthase assembly protein I